jgi:chaperone required for assembly of F1-ATPase
MRDLLEDIFSHHPLDPTEAARRAMRPQPRRRFFHSADTAGLEGESRLLLDGRPVRTPGRRLLAAPSQALADAIATEWQAQREVIDPATMPLTRLANTIIDGVADRPAAVSREIESYLGTDLVLYRAEGPAGLRARQAEAWDPVLDWARDAFGARFVLATGLVHVAQPVHAVAAAAAAIPGDPWPLGAVHAATTLTGSALIALALAQGALSLEAAWAAAHVDEDWNMALWGIDALAMERRAFRFAEMQAAMLVLQSCSCGASPPPPAGATAS